MMDERDLLTITAAIILAAHKDMLQDAAIGIAAALIEKANAKAYQATPEGWYATHEADDPPPF